MKLRFLKKLTKNILVLTANFGIMYSFHVVAERYFGEGLYGLLAYLGFLMIPEDIFSSLITKNI